MGAHQSHDTGGSCLNKGVARPHHDPHSKHFLPKWVAPSLNGAHRGEYSSISAPCLVTKRQLLWLAQSNKMSRGESDKALQRFSQMRLIVVASLIDGVKYGNALL